MQSTRYFVLIAALLAAVSTATAIAQAQTPPLESQEQLINVLTSPDASKAEKAITCKKLAVCGWADAVPALAALLPDRELTSWARIALEAIPGPEADAALRDALRQTEGRTRVGVINSIGVRKDPQAVDALVALLASAKSEETPDANSDVPSAAAVALGCIATPDAQTALVEALETAPEAARSAVAEGIILCAEKRLAEGKNDEAAALYDAVRETDVPKIRIVEATRGAILARGSAGVPLLIAQLQSSDRALLRIGLATARELPGEDVTRALVGELEQIVPDRRALLILALADRGDAAAMPAMLDAAAHGSSQVRRAAIDVLRQIGDLSCVPTLLRAATEEDEAVAVAAKSALVGLSDEAVNADLAERLEEAEGATRHVLIELVGARRIDATAPLLAAAEDDDASIRQAALIALGETVGLENLSVLIDRVVGPAHAEDAPVAEQALRAAAVRMPDREACAAELTAAMTRGGVPSQSLILEILTAMGGPRALETVGAAAGGDSRELQDKASQLLGGWMTVDAGPVLLSLAADGDNPFRVRALRGYLRIARQFLMSEDERAGMCENALAVAERDAERALILEIAQRYPSARMLRLAVDVGKSSSALRDQAAAASIAVAQEIGDSADVRDLLAQMGQKLLAIEIVRAQYGAGDDWKDVTDILRRHEQDFPLIVLPSTSYNSVFGGDPAPGVVKQLQVEYTVEGQSKQAAFDENATILLPTP